MKLKKIIIPGIILLVILVALVSYPLSTYLKDYNHSKELYNKAVNMYSSDDIERHSRALKLLNNIPAVLDVLKIEDSSIYLTIDNPYRVLRNELRAEIEDDYQLFYREFLDSKYKNSLIAYLEDYVVLNFVTIKGEIKDSIDLSYLNDGRQFENIRWSPDGNFIVLTDRLSLYLLDVESREVKKLVGDGKARYYYPSWSSNSKEVLFVKSSSRELGQIKLIDISGQNERLVKSVGQSHVFISYPHFFNNDQKIIFNNGINNFEIIDRTGNALSIFDIPYRSLAVSLKSLLNSSQALEFMNSSKNRDYLIFYKGEAKMLKLDSMEVTEVEGFRAHSWAPDDSLWLYENSEEEIFLKPENMGAIEILTGTFPAWSPVLSEEILATFD